MKNTDHQKSANTAMTLNGIDQTTALTLITNFNQNKKNDRHPAKTSIWFPKQTIKNMMDLLDAEIAEEKLPECTKGRTDGIRIYFTWDGTYANHKMNNSIVLVSTKNYAPNPSASSGALHVDYYTHVANAPLFSENKLDLQGRASKMNLGDIFTSKDLYDVYNVYFRVFHPNDTCSGYHFLSRGKANKMVNQFGKAPITTISEWFDLDLFRNIANQDKIDGLRIYFARHPSKYHRDTDVNKYKEAFVLVTTITLKIGKNIYHKDNYICLATSNHRCTTGVYHHNDTGGGDDKGELCPDACNPGDTLNATHIKNQPLHKKRN